jgi:hypothetical protein
MGNDSVRFAKCNPLTDAMKAMWHGGVRKLPLSKALIMQKRGQVSIGSIGDGLGMINYLDNLVHKKVIYTAVYGNKDGLPTFKRLPSDWDIICFTDNPELSSKSWKIVYCNPKHKDPTRCAREIKLTPHILFPNHEISAWIDANLNITCRVNEYFDRFIEGNDFVALNHWQNVVGPFHEIERCVQLKKDNDSIMHEQRRAYRAAGMPIDQEVVWTAILLRRHNKQHIKAFCDMWLKELGTWSRRDQISFPFCAWKLGLKYSTMPGLGPWFKRVNHKWGGWK